jgi:hypothetical protein
MPSEVRSDKDGWRPFFLHKSRRSDKKAAVDAIYAFLEKHLDPPQVWPLGSWESNGSVGNG